MHDNVETLVGMLSFALLFGSAFVWAAIFRRLAARRAPVAFEPRLSVPWSGFDVVLLVVALLFFELIAASLAGGAETAPADGLSPARLAAGSVSRIAWLAFAVGYLVIKRGAYFDDLGFDSSRLRSDLRLGGRAFLAGVVPVFVVQWFFVYVLDWESKHPIVELMETRPNIAVMVLATFMAVVVAPVFEEFVFRVLLQGWLEKQQARLRARRTGDDESRPGFAPIVIVSVVFAALHAGHGPDPYALFLFSLFLGYVYRQTHRVFPSIVVHGCLNGLAMVSLWMAVYAGKPGAPVPESGPGVALAWLLQFSLCP